MKRLIWTLSIVALFAAASAQTFYTPNKYALPSHPDKMVVADINHDGHADVAYGEASTGHVDIEMNDGHGAYAGVHFCAPASSASVSKSAAKFLASAHPLSGPTVRMELWMDGKKVFQTYDDRLSRTISTTAGTHTATIVSVDSANKVTKVSQKFTAK